MNSSSIGPFIVSLGILVTYGTIKARDLSAPLWLAKQLSVWGGS